MKQKRISIHAISLFVWLMSSIVYLYSQNNAYSCAFVLIFLFWLSRHFIRLRWKDLAYSWSMLSIGLILFYGLFLHAGNYALFEIPGKLPIISGIVSLNSVLYGFFLGGSFSMALFLFSLFSTFLNQQRPRFYLPGLGSNFSVLFSFLSHYVSFFLHHRDEFQEKIKNRGLEVSWMTRAKLFLHDSSFHAFENAFAFSETLEMRGFSREDKNEFSTLDMALVFVSFAILFFIVLYRIEHQNWMAMLSILLILIWCWMIKRLREKSAAANMYRYGLDIRDWIVLVWSAIFLTWCLYVSFESQSFLSKQTIAGYLVFDWKTHLLFLVHSMVAICLFQKMDAK